MDKKLKTIVIIPTYNEVQHIERLISEIVYSQPEFYILVVDDNSPDRTGMVVQELSKINNKIKVLHRSRKTGLGKAYVEGFRHVLSREPHYEMFIQMDADFSHHPKYLKDLINAMENNDFCIGSRYIFGGRIIDWRLDRRFLSYVANFYTRFFLRIKVKDCTSGFRCFKREVLENINIETIKADGYLFQIEVINRCLQNGYVFTEVPITFIERKEGKSKLGFYEILEAFWGVLKLSISNSTNKFFRKTYKFVK